MYPTKDFSGICKEFLQISKSKTDNIIEKWAKDLYKPLHKIGYSNGQ